MNVRHVRRRLAISAIVLGAIGASSIAVVVPREQYILAPWYAIPVIVAGPLLVVLALVLLVLRALLPSINARKNTARRAYVIAFVALAILLGLVATFFVVVLEYFGGALAYCIPINFDGCAP